MARLRICVIDGQGGGIGAALIKRLKEVYGEEHEVIALGTNAVATAQMMKARANRGASGENAIIRTVASADVVLGCLSIVLANSMMGELTPKMAEAIASAPAPKILLPLTQEAVQIVGLSPEPLPHLVEQIVSQKLREIIEHV
jgi:NAD(P)-dependent dehydrogenase (short-subunit alcohol dehydrogenase family)